MPNGNQKLRAVELYTQLLLTKKDEDTRRAKKLDDWFFITDEDGSKEQKYYIRNELEIREGKSYEQISNFVKIMNYLDRRRNLKFFTFSIVAPSITIGITIGSYVLYQNFLS